MTDELEALPVEIENILYDCACGVDYSISTQMIMDIIHRECTKAQLQLLERLKLPSIGTIDIPDDGIFKIARPKGNKPSIYEDMYRYHQKNIDQLIDELSNKENK